MDNTVANNNASSSNASKKGIPLTGTFSGVEIKNDVKGNPYVRATFETKLKGKPAKRTFLAFGKAYNNLKDVLSNGSTVAVYGILDGGVFRGISQALPPKAA